MREAACCRGASCLLCFPFGGPQPYGRAGSRGIWGSWGWRSPAEAALGAGGPRYHFVHLQEHFGEAELEGIVPPPTPCWDTPVPSAALTQPSTWKQLSLALGTRWSSSLAGD